MILVFGGTTEGRLEALRRSEEGSEVLVSVTSEYARRLLPESIPCHTGVLDAKNMCGFLERYHPDKVIDATHPFAVQATRNISSCCRDLAIPYERVTRPDTSAGWSDAVEWAEDTLSAAKALELTVGNILLTTGSKTVSEYTKVIPAERLWVRVLPTHAALDLCAQAGIIPSHIIAMQGPFTEAMNAATYDMLNIQTMVTKDSGKAGGVDEKVIPALARDIHVIAIKRPAEDK